MSAGRKPLPLEEAIKRSHANLRIAASTSFTEAEVQGIDELFRAMRRGADTRLMARSPVLANVQRKVQTMVAAIARQKERRAAKEAATAGTIPEVEALLDDPSTAALEEDGIAYAVNALERPDGSVEVRSIDLVGTEAADADPRDV
jgi:hypothetical protein